VGHVDVGLMEASIYVPSRLSFPESSYHSFHVTSILEVSTIDTTPYRFCALPL